MTEQTETTSPALPSPHNNEAVLTLNTRTLMLGLLLLGGGTAGGIGSTVFGESKLPPEVRANIEATKAAVDLLGTDVRAMTTSLGELRADMRAAHANTERLTEEIKDHEKRIRDLERRLR